MNISPGQPLFASRCRRSDIRRHWSILALVWVVAGLMTRTACRGGELTTGITPAGKEPSAVVTGHQLYLMNCAHCHAQDATGDDGPDLHGVVKSDAKIAALIKDGKKGQMPRFGSKLSDADIQALVAFVDSLK
jgi:mono/diheme cytochrome c family protein